MTFHSDRPFVDVENKVVNENWLKLYTIACNGVELQTCMKMAKNVQYESLLDGKLPQVIDLMSTHLRLDELQFNAKIYMRPWVYNDGLGSLLQQVLLSESEGRCFGCGA